jgi:hypothetical protein
MKKKKFDIVDKVLMMDNDSLKICQVEENTCKREVQAHCYHCSKSMCRMHFVQHVQLIEEKTRAELNSLADKFNELSSRFEQMIISPDILEKPFIELEKWRVKAHEKIDQIVEDKRREIDGKIEEYRIIFAEKNNEQLQKINASKKIMAELIQDADASRKQMDDLQTSIDEAEKYLQSLLTHGINVINSSPICYVDIDTQFFDYQPRSNDELREFKITYIGWNGFIRDYYVKTNQSGTMSDLINSFIKKYALIQEFARVESNSEITKDHQPKSNFILPIEIYNHRIHLQYRVDVKLSNILDRDVIVFYETPHSLDGHSNSHILMPCLFQRLPEKQSFAFPIYLEVPRNECKGQDVLDALQNMLGRFFQLNPSPDQNLYHASLVFVAPGGVQRTCKALTDALEDSIDFGAVNTSLMVDIDKKIADIYENNKYKDEGFQ